jgi:hypothetical protein
MPPASLGFKSSERERASESARNHCPGQAPEKSYIDGAAPHPGGAAPLQAARIKVYSKVMVCSAVG